MKMHFISLITIILGAFVNVCTAFKLNGSGALFYCLQVERCNDCTAVLI
jgi:hypothetical protein